MVFQAVLDIFLPRSPDTWLTRNLKEVAGLRDLVEEMRQIKIELREAVVKLSYERDRFQALSETMNCGALIYRNTEVIVANEMLQGWLGYTEKELQETPDLLNQCFNKKDLSIVNRHKKTNDMSSYDVTITSRTGEKTKVIFHPKMVNFNGHGLCRGVCVTEYKERT